MAALGLALGLYGGGKAASAEQKAGYSEEQRALYTAKALELEAKNVVAEKQKQGFEERRMANLLASRALALAAAGGGDASDVTVMNIIADIDSEGVYRQQVAMYEGESQKQLKLTEAQSMREYGKSRKEAGEARAEARWLGSFGNAFSNYG